MNTDFTLMVRSGTTPFTSRISLEICPTPWATTRAWCSAPRTGIMTNTRTPAVPTTTQVQQICTCLFSCDGINESLSSSISCTTCNFFHLPGGWWFNACGDANLNGRYFNMRPKGRLERRKGIHWRAGPKASYSLKFTQISVQPVASPRTASPTSASSDIGVFQWSCSDNLQRIPIKHLFHVDSHNLRRLWQRGRCFLQWSNAVLSYTEKAKSMCYCSCQDSL